MKRTELKRTEFKRKVTQWAKPGASITRSPMKKKRKKKPATHQVGKHWQCQKYLDWVKTQSCVLTGEPAEDAHHIIGVGNFGGMGMTAPDFMVIPVTRESHQKIHADPELQKWQGRWVLQTLEKAFRDGVLGYTHPTTREAK